jgi:alanyl-tRNA synthetase
MTASDLRASFINFFKQKEHTFVPSSPVVPLDDPTLLFTNAGMNQFKDVFLNTGSRPYSRAVNSQKCIRVSGKHNDLEEVGHDTYHHTFFEMLGNWSFGDYYKEEAIAWAWELLTKVWGLPTDRLYATIFREDDQAEKLWPKVAGISPQRVLRFDEKDNFWEMGETGPCGPCSEIHIDLGAQYCDHKGKKHTCAVNGGCGRYIELWNLVFIQYNRDENGKLHLLPAKHVDTGAGFERLVAVLQNKTSNYDTDLFIPILDHIARLCGIPYAESTEQVAYRVIADHIRMLTFSLADGGFPSNEGRGYVMRRILRRAARYGRKLNFHEPFIYQLLPTVIAVLGDMYPEINEKKAHITKVIQSEEEHFNRTLDRGLDIFERIKTKLHRQKKKIIPGDEVFRLYDTYGFPVDLTRVMAEEAGLQVDQQLFDRKMTEQRRRAREAAKFQSAGIKSDTWHILDQTPVSEFIGYEEDAIETHIAKYALHKDKIHITLAKTPFYAESGGQVADTGIIITDSLELPVVDTQKEGGEIIHICTLSQKFELASEKVLAQIDTDKRRQTEKNHTATHLLHAALRKILGEHVQQAGSLVTPDRLRFDFSHFEKPSPQALVEIEQLVNQKIQEDIALEIAIESFEKAKKRGAMALFGEKYSDQVRTIQINAYSLELCGGTHVRRTGEIGLFVIVYEGSIAAGMRRIEALTGKAAVAYLQHSRTTIDQLSLLLNAQSDMLPQKINALLTDKRNLEKELDKLKGNALSADLDTVIAHAETVNNLHLIIHAISDGTIDDLKKLGDTIREKTKNTIALLGSIKEGKIGLVCVVTDDLVSKKYNAGDLVRQVARIAGGSGGGRPHMATAGAKDLNKFDEAMQSIRRLI